MNVYDFDGTIYDGDSSADFLTLLIRKKPLASLVRMPKFLLAFVGYKTKKIRKEDMKEVFFSLLNMYDDPEALVKEFWKINHHKIKIFYYENRRADDVIISASPEFLIRPIAEEFGFVLIGSPIDMHTGKYSGINCHGEEKIRRLKEIYGDGVVVDDFYSDSIVDLPLAKFATKAYLVTGDKIEDWKF